MWILRVVVTSVAETDIGLELKIMSTSLAERLGLGFWGCFAFGLFGQWAAASVSDAVSVRLSVCSELDMLENFTAFQIAKKYYWKCKTLKLPRFLQEQLLRASSSIGLNLAEGSGKRTPADQRRFYAIAFGSLRECQAILELEQINDTELKDLGNQLGAILFTLSRKPIPKNWTKTVSDTVAAAAPLLQFPVRVFI